MDILAEDVPYASYHDRILAYRKALWVTPLLTKELVIVRERRTLEDWI